MIFESTGEAKHKVPPFPQQTTTFIITTTENHHFISIPEHGRKRPAPRQDKLDFPFPYDTTQRKSKVHTRGVCFQRNVTAKCRAISACSIVPQASTGLVLAKASQDPLASPLSKKKVHGIRHAANTQQDKLNLLRTTSFCWSHTCSAKKPQGKQTPKTTQKSCQT